MKIAIAFFFLILSLACAQAQTCNSPQAWSIVGQTAPDPVTNFVDNPSAGNPSGLMGRQTLPYIVPLGSYLEITDMIGEKYNVSGTIVYAPYTGTSPAVGNDPFLFSLSASNQSNSFHGSVKLSAGTQFNLKIMDNEPLAPSTHQVVGWNISGRLCSP